jgi:hypothetical protein
MRASRGRALAVAVLLAVLTGCGGDATSGPPASAPPTTPSSTGGATETPFADSTEPVAVEAGTYRIQKSAWSVVDFTVTFPQGWAVQYGNVFFKQSDTDGVLGLDAAVVDRIYADACEGSNGELMQVGPSVDDLATALHEQAGPMASDPVATTVGGYAATRIDLTVPKGFDLKACNVKGIGLEIWYSAPADKHFVLLPDVLASVYIVDVDGQRQVFMTQYPSATSDKDLRELQAVIDSIHIET